MTVMNESRTLHRNFGIRRHIGQLFCWWLEHRQQKRDARLLLELPDRLLRDVSLEHLIASDDFAKSCHQWI